MNKERFQQLAGISEHTINTGRVFWKTEDEFFRSTGKVIDWYSEEVTDEDYDGEGTVTVTGKIQGVDTSLNRYVADFTGAVDSDYELKPETVDIYNIKLVTVRDISEHIVRPKKTVWKDEEDFENDTGKLIQWFRFKEVETSGTGPGHRVTGIIEGNDDLGNIYQAELEGVLDGYDDIDFHPNSTLIFNIRLVK